MEIKRITHEDRCSLCEFYRVGLVESARPYFRICDDCLEEVVKAAGWDVEKEGEEPIWAKRAESIAAVHREVFAALVAAGPEIGDLATMDLVHAVTALAKERDEARANPAIEWRGEPEHFCGVNDCVFHTHTHVNGKWCVSTVGEWYPGGRWKKDGAQTKVGSGLYESMVFRVVGDGIDLHELETIPYNDREAAQKGHMALVEKYRGMS